MGLVLDKYINNSDKYQFYFNQYEMALKYLKMDYSPLRNRLINENSMSDLLFFIGSAIYDENEIEPEQLILLLKRFVFLSFGSAKKLISIEEIMRFDNMKQIECDPVSCYLEMKFNNKEKKDIYKIINEGKIGVKEYNNLKGETSNKECKPLLMCFDYFGEKNDPIIDIEKAKIDTIVADIIYENKSGYNFYFSVENKSCLTNNIIDVDFSKSESKGFLVILGYIINLIMSEKKDEYELKRNLARIISSERDIGITIKDSGKSKIKFIDYDYIRNTFKVNYNKCDEFEFYYGKNKKASNKYLFSKKGIIKI